MTVIAVEMGRMTNSRSSVIPVRPRCRRRCRHRYRHRGTDGIGRAIICDTGQKVSVVTDRKGGFVPDHAVAEEHVAEQPLIFVEHLDIHHRIADRRADLAARWAHPDKTGIGDLAGKLRPVA